MSADLTNVSTEDLKNELLRRKAILEEKTKDISSVPIEYLISEWEKRSKDLERMTLETFEAIKEFKNHKIDIDTSEQVILFNAIKTPDGTVLTSRHVRDYVTHEDSKTGKIYGVDGGADYLRRVGDVSEDCEDLSITNQTPFEVVRQNFHWGSYGKDGDKVKTMRRLKDISNSHLQAIIENVKFPIGSHYKRFFEMEYEYRKQKSIFVDEY